MFTPTDWLGVFVFFMFAYWQWRNTQEIPLWYYMFRRYGRLAAQAEGSLGKAFIFMVPDAIFGIVWPVFYILLATVGFLFWKYMYTNAALVSDTGYRLYTSFLVMYLFHMVLNKAWSVVFFGRRVYTGRMLRQEEIHLTPKVYIPTTMMPTYVNFIIALLILFLMFLLNLGQFAVIIVILAAVSTAGTLATGIIGIVVLFLYGVWLLWAMILNSIFISYAYFEFNPSKSTQKRVKAAMLLRDITPEDQKKLFNLAQLIMSDYERTYHNERPVIASQVSSV